MADADDATSALIARLLAEDNFAATGYAGGWEQEEPDYDDETYGQKKKKRKTKKRKTAKAKPKSTATKATPKAKKVKKAPEPAASAQSSANATTDGAAKPKRVVRKWTSEEEELFLQALDKFGRDWAACVKHMNHSRNVNSFKSHAQKHFIKLYRNGHCLPEEVRKSGEGFTLSGKPLDPNSAAARAYGALKPPTNGQPLTEEQLQNRSMNDELLAAQKESGVMSRQKVAATSPEEQANLERQKADAKAAKEAAKVAKAAEVAKKKEERRVQRELAAAQRIQARMRKSAEKQAAVAHLYGEDGRTEYSRRRGRRAAASRFGSRIEDSFSFVTCKCYHGGVTLAGSGAPKTQPFRVTVSAAASLVSDVHAHLTHSEVIGYLAGTYDKEARHIQILAAYPGRSISNDSDAHREAEMDPVYEVELRSRIESDGHTIVGWYHSHPTFQPVPSAVDVNNQRNYQQLFHLDRRQSSPFVGLIVSPYNPSRPTTQSEFQWFYIEGTATDPQAMTVEASRTAITSESKLDLVQLKKQISGVLGAYAEDYLSIRVGFTDVWRQVGERVYTNMDKIVASWRLHFKEHCDANVDADAPSPKHATEQLDQLVKWLKRQCIAEIDIPPSPSASPEKQQN